MIKNKVIVVTGASSGIGKALSEKLVEEGARVLGLCRRVEEVPSGVEGYACDLGDEGSVRDFFEGVDRLDGLVNNAGVAYLSSIMDGSLEDWDTMWKVNVRALALCSQLALKKFSTAGQIINVSSMSGHRVPPSGGFYSPTKFAVKAITESLRLELRQAKNASRVSSVSPGFVETPLLDDYFSGREEDLKKTKQAMKMLDAGDVADVILNILKTPLHVEVGDVQLRSVEQNV